MMRAAVFRSSVIMISGVIYRAHAAFVQQGSFDQHVGADHDPTGSAEKIGTQGHLSGLPEVNAVLAKASHNMKDFTAQAKVIKEQVIVQQAKSRAALATKKEEYERILAEQQSQLRDVSNRNAAMKANNSEIILANSLLERRAAALQKGNAILGDALRSLKAKVSFAVEFISDSVNATNDAQASELSVLTTTSPKPSVEYFLNIAREKLGLASDSVGKTSSKEQTVVVGPHASLLQVQAATPTGVLNSTGQNYKTPEDLVALLSQSLSKLTLSEEKGKASLKAAFLSRLATSKDKLTQLTAEQASLQASTESLVALRADLEMANRILTGTRSKLLERLNGFRMFAKKVDRACAATMQASSALFH